MKQARFGQPSQKIITSIDIGSSKVCCIIARINGSDATPTILGLGHHGIQGVKQGFTPNMDALENAILNAVHKAEKAANLTVKQAFLNISGNHLLSEIVKVTTDVQGHGVDDADIKRLMIEGTSINPSKNFSIVHANPIKFSLDNGQPVKNPKGMYGKTLTGYLHIVTAQLNTARTIVNCLRHCHIEVKGIIPSAIASGFSSLVDDEIDLGVILIDLGSHYTNVAIFMNGDVVHTESIPLGSASITSDLAHGLSTSWIAAERIKILHGNTLETSEDSRIMVDVPQMDDGQHENLIQVRRSLVTAIIKPRAEEILELVKKRLEKSGVYKITSRRVVLTGGGSQLSGLKELTHHILNKQARLGKPLNLLNSKENYRFPSFSTCTGLLTFALRQNYSDKGADAPQKGWISPLFKWFKDNF